MTGAGEYKKEKCRQRSADREQERRTRSPLGVGDKTPAQSPWAMNDRLHKLFPCHVP